MTEQQLAEIEKRWADNEVTMQTINDFNLLLAEVKRLNRMVDCSIWWHENCSDCDVCHRKLDCSLLGCGNAWRKYLESEVAERG